MECPFLSVSARPVESLKISWVLRESKTSMGLGTEGQEKSLVEKTGRVTYGRPKAGKTEMPRWTQGETDTEIERKIAE